MAFGKLPSAEKGWLQMMKAMEECTIEAALTGDYGKALEAFVLNPLVENNENTTKVLDELLVAHAKYLPQFKEKIEELKAKGVHSTDPVVMDLMNMDTKQEADMGVTKESFGFLEDKREAFLYTIENQNGFAVKLLILV